MRVYTSNSNYEQETCERKDKPFITPTTSPVFTKIVIQLDHLAL